MMYLQDGPGERRADRLAAREAAPLGSIEALGASVGSVDRNSVPCSGRLGDPVSRLAQQCLAACRILEVEARRALAAEPGFVAAGAHCSQDLLAFCACAGTCRLAVAAIDHGAGRLDEVRAWCAEMSDACGRLLVRSDGESPVLAAAAHQCAIYCQDLAANLRTRVPGATQTRLGGERAWTFDSRACGAGAA